MEVLIKVVQFFLSLTVLVLIHEAGHYLTARLFKIRVEKFYIFFNPWFSLLRTKVVNGKRYFSWFSKKSPDFWKETPQNTEWGIGWLPLGGYVKIAGMIDESMDKEQMKQPPQPWEFRIKPAWQRLIVMVAGVFMNVCLAVAIYISLLFIFGESYIPTKNLKYGIAVDTMAYNIGLRDGDKILSVDNKFIENFKDIPLEIVFNQSKSIQIQRDTQRLDIQIPDGFIGKIIDNKNLGFIDVRFPFVIEGFADQSLAKDAGMLLHDSIVAVNDTPAVYYNEIKRELVKNINKQITLTVIRNNEPLVLSMKLGEAPVIGVMVKEPSQFIDIAVKKYTFWQAIPAGTVKTYKTIIDYIRQFKLLFTSKEVKVSENLGGFISIGKIFAPQWDWVHFWSITALLSVILAFMNILPIPALDGGHVIFLLYEMITRRKPSEKVLEYAQYAGLIILLALVLFANINDVVKLFR